MEKTKTLIVLIIFLLNIIVFSKTLSPKEIIIIHAFLFGVMVVSERIEKKIIKKEKKLLLMFLTTNIFRAALIILFLFPLIFFSHQNNIEKTINFFLIYFLHLIIGIIYKHKAQKV